MHTASIEQQSIVNSLETHNVIADAVAGSGKTTTVMHIAKHYHNDSILLMTYNKKLRLETKKRALENNLDNLMVHNYHSFAVKYYDPKCHTDVMIKKYLNKPSIKSYKFTIIIIDEAQDMTQLYYKLMCKIFKENNFPATICVLGDRYQSIYDFNGADSRYITMADKLFAINKLPWKMLTLSQTFRVPNNICKFINKCVLKNNRLTSASNIDTKPVYLFCDAFGKRPYLQVIEYLKTYSCGDIFILAPSVRSDNSPVKKLANALSNNNINIYIPVTDEEKLDEDIIKNKLVFSSFHQVKGLERPVIIMFAFDKGYFDFNCRTADPYTCTNALYVALTRSLQHLTLVHHYESHFLPFLNNKLIGEYCDVESIDNAIIKKTLNPKYLNSFRQNNNNFCSDLFHNANVRIIDKILNETAKNVSCKTFEVSAKEVCKNIKSEIIEHALSYINMVVVNPPCCKAKKIDLSMKAQQRTSHESVYEINETAIPSYFEFINTGKMTIVEILNGSSFVQDTKIDYMDEDSEKEEIEKNDLDVKITYDNISLSYMLYISNAYNCMTNKVIHKLRQITNYDWICEEQMNLCIERLHKHISPTAKYMISICAAKRDELRNRKIYTCVDCQDNNNIYKFNCSNHIENKEILNFAVEMYVFNIFNDIQTFKTKKMIELELEYDHLTKNIQTLEDTKYKFQQCMMSIIKYKMNHNIQRDINVAINLMKEKQNTIMKELQNTGSCFNFYLFNITTHEIIQISASTDQLVSMMTFLIKKKYYDRNIINDDEFIENGLDIFDNFIN